MSYVARCRKMRRGDVHGRVVVSEHLEPWLEVAADGHGCEQRDEIPRLALRVFSDLTRRVSTGGTAERERTQGS